MLSYKDEAMRIVDEVGLASDELSNALEDEAALQTAVRESKDALESTESDAASDAIMSSFLGQGPLVDDKGKPVASTGPAYKVLLEHALNTSDNVQAARAWLRAKEDDLALASARVEALKTKMTALRISANLIVAIMEAQTVGVQAQTAAKSAEVAQAQAAAKTKPRAIDPVSDPESPGRVVIHAGTPLDDGRVPF